MIHELPELTLKEAADLMDYSTISEVSEKVREALELSFGTEDDKEKKRGTI